MNQTLYIQNAFAATGAFTDDVTELYLGNSLDPCVCIGETKFLKMLTTSFAEPSNYPVEVYDVNVNLIGVAANSDAYIQVWNSSSINRNVGLLSAGLIPFSFKLVRNIAALPNNVFGNPVVISNRILKEASGYILQEDGSFILIE